MDSVVIDNLLGTSLIPTIMGLMVGRMYSDDKSDLLYVTAAVGTTIATATSALNFQIRYMTRSRHKLTLLTTILLTASLLTSIVGFHLIRHNFSPSRLYILPESIRETDRTNQNDTFRKHLIADLVPGFILFLQTQLCSMLTFELMNRVKRTFTLGESFIVAQLVSATFLIWAFSTYTRVTGGGPFIIEQTTSILLNIGMILFTLVFVPSYLNLIGTSTFMRYSILVLGLSSAYAVTLNLVKTAKIGDPLTWLVDHIFATHQRISLFSLWLATVAGCVSFSTSWSSMIGQTNSLVRKVFHLAICVIFISGYNQDIEFTSFASGGMIILMSLLELIRGWSLWPFGSYLEKVCRSLRGKWDNRYLTLSHIYLLTGTMLPIWLTPPGYESKLVYSSGLIAIGIGDTAAAVVGTIYGRNKFKRSEKTLEGFAANIVAMAMFKLIWIGYTGFIDEFSFAMAAIMTSFSEIISANCDNLVLPLVMMFSLQVF